MGQNSYIKPLLECNSLTKHFAIRHGVWQRIQGYVHAVEEVSLTVYQGETFGLVGESGCGKSTLSRMIVGLLHPSSGELFFNGQSIFDSVNRKALRHKLQMIFQDPFSSLNPRLPIGISIAEPLTVLKVSAKKKLESIIEILEFVGLQPEQKDRYPHEFSGGQRQRIAIARALIAHPELLVCDEAVSSLDVSVQAQVLNLLKDLQEHFGLTYVFISHDLAVVGYMSDRVAVMYLGRIVELAPTKSLFERPAHPYTQTLLDSIPIPDPFSRKTYKLLKGELPSPLSPPSGCPFHLQCPKVMPICRTELPQLTVLKQTELVEKNRFVRCFLYT